MGDTELGALFRVSAVPILPLRFTASPFTASPLLPLPRVPPFTLPRVAPRVPLPPGRPVLASWCYALGLPRSYILSLEENDSAWLPGRRSKKS